MAKAKKAAEIIPASTVKALERIEKDDKLTGQGSRLLLRARALVTEMAYPNARGLANADAELGRVLTLKEEVEGEFGAILDPLNASRTAALKLKKKCMDPIDDAETELRRGMKVWRQAELDESRRVQEENLRIERQKLRDAEELRRKAEAAKTLVAKARLTAQADQVEMSAAQPTPPAPVRVAGSVTRTVRKWAVTDMAEIINGVVMGEIPIEVLGIDEAFVNLKFRQNETIIGTWPGFKVYDDVTNVRVSA